MSSPSSPYVYALSLPVAASLCIRVSEHPRRLAAPLVFRTCGMSMKNLTCEDHYLGYGTGFRREGQGGLPCRCQTRPIFVEVVYLFDWQFLGKGSFVDCRKQEHEVIR